MKWFGNHRNNFDNFNNKIKKISPGAVVTTLAGYTQSYRDGKGTNAWFAIPQGVTTDAQGNLYVADTYNHRIRKITPDTEVTTLAGSTEGFADGVGANARFKYPFGICADLQGNLVVSDRSNHGIRKITPQGAVTTLAGSTGGYVDAVGTGAKFSQPAGVAIDPQGNIYVADSENHVIRKVTTAGAVSTLAGSTQGFADGTGTQAKFDYPFGITSDTHGNIYITELGNHKIRKITPSGIVTTIAGTTEGMQNGNVKVAQFSRPYGIVAERTNSNILYVADNNSHTIRKIVTE